jgi:hypothetical protein
VEKQTGWTSETPDAPSVIELSYWIKFYASHYQLGHLAPLAPGDPPRRPCLLISNVIAPSQRLAAAIGLNAALALPLALKPVEWGEDETRQFGVLSKKDTGDRHQFATGRRAHASYYQ